MSAISFLLFLYSWSLHPGWLISSSGSNFVTKWLHLSSSDMCLGNHGTGKKFQYLTQIWQRGCRGDISLLLATLVDLVERSWTLVRKLLLLSVLTRLTKLPCLMSKRKSASSFPDAASNAAPPSVFRVSMWRICPLWVWNSKLLSFTPSYQISISCKYFIQTSTLDLKQHFLFWLPG